MDAEARKSPRAIRLAAGVSQIQVAVRTGTSEPTVRIYEADPNAVRSPKKRAALDAEYASMRELTACGGTNAA